MPLPFSVLCVLIAPHLPALEPLALARHPVDPVQYTKLAKTSVSTYRPCARKSGCLVMFCATASSSVSPRNEDERRVLVEADELTHDARDDGPQRLREDDAERRLERRQPGACAASICPAGTDWSPPRTISAT